MTLPTPRTGLVVHYSFLWSTEFKAGLEEGRKDRPCAIVTAIRQVDGVYFVTVVPITHAAPDDVSVAVEIPASIKRTLGLDEQRSWILVGEANEFSWPGPDLRSIPGSSPPRYVYGSLPPRFYETVRQRLMATIASRKLTRVPRTS